MLVSTRSVAFVLFAAGCGLGNSGNDLDVTPDSGGTQSLQCTAALACPTPSSTSKQTICGQLFDLENNARFGDATTGAACTPNATSGPCSLAISAYDAIAFAQNPAATAPLAHGSLYLDSCGRYRLEDIDVTGIGPFIAVSVDDAAGRGPAGTTVTAAVATAKIAGSATDQLETWIVKESTTQQWAATGGPLLANGVFVPVFRAHQADTPSTDPFEPQSGVTVTLQGNPVTQYYFDAASVDRTTVDAAAVTTGANGTALIENATVSSGVAYGGTGGLSDAACRWTPHVGASLPGVVFVQIFRPTDVVGQTCSL